MDYQFKKGVALCFVGAQGSGKTTEALKIAKAHGEFFMLGAHELSDCFGLAPLIDGNVKTLIVEDVCTEEHLAILKSVLSASTITVRARGRSNAEVGVPNIIITATGPVVGTLINSPRRFDVVVKRDEGR